ncbi:MAG: hypothetical protein R3232_04810 [Clostridia bacterium]|nr:hypothetical protein [Clostridia bacterium]
MKKIFVMLVTIIVIFSSSTVFAADPLYRMTNPEYFPGDQDAMILGQIKTIEGEIITITVLKVINGSVDGDSIRVDGLFTYIGFSPENADARAGDFCIIAIKKYDEFYKVIYPDRAVLADSGDYKTLRCLHDASNPQGGDAPAIQWYVNSGGMENGFAFGSGRAYVTRPNGERVDITDIALEISFDKDGNRIISGAPEEIPNPNTRALADSTLILLSGVVLSIIAMIAIAKTKAIRKSLRD